MKKLLTVMLTLCGLLCFAVGCGQPSHEHSFTQKVTTATFKASDATCTTKAQYFYSCECGEKNTSTFEYGEVLGHDFIDYVSNNDATCTEDGTETATCDRAGCNEKHTRTQNNTALSHNYGTPTYTWSDDECTATRICANDNTHVETESVSATLTTETQPTYFATGSGSLEAAFTNPAFETQTKSVVLPMKDALLSFDGAIINGYEIIYVVSSETTSVNFTDIISVPEDCSFAILDPYYDPIENNDTANLWQLYQGNNDGYKLRITADGNDGYDIIYPLTIHRICEVTIYYYDSTIGETLYSETITSAQEYVPNAEYVNNLAGYTFNRFTDYYYNDYQVTTLYGDTYIYVDRTPKTYTVTFDENAGDMAGTTTEITYNSVPQFRIPQRPGCTFLGWQLNGAQITDRYGNGYYDAKWNIDSDQTVYALWDYSLYDIDYRLDGGKNSSDNITHYYAYDEEPFVLNDATRDDVSVVTSYETAVFKAEDGSSEKLAGIDYYTNSKIRVNRTATKYTFDGWYTDENFENVVTELNFTFGTIVLYAKWIEQDPVEEVAEVDWLVVNENNEYDPDGEYLLMGTYPQTIKSADVAIDTTLNGSNGWNVGSDGNLYKAISASPYNSEYSPRTYYFSDNTKIVKGQTYYFKLEPMRWRIINNPKTGGWAMLMADKAIDSNIYDLQKEPGYENSFLREFFLTNFYGMHFAQSTKDLMVTNPIYNDRGSTKEDGWMYPFGFEDVWDSNPFLGKALNDPIYAYSASELTSDSLGFSTKFTTKDEKRTVKPTDYALAKGAAARTADDQYKGNVSWWTRTPYPLTDNGNTAVMTVSADGSLAMEDRYSYAFGLTRPDSSGYGIVPSVRLNIKSF